MNAIMLWVIQTSAEVALGIFIEKLLSDANRKRASKLLKHQVLVVYLNWVLLKTPLDPKKLHQYLEQQQG
ncbi:hypothetical protein SAMD00079811_74600 [Scytonema sp. HK-05]|uniref:hypothetical protein n=1 Tax=Scytonema sp. HK-05 TaxID=1137095 RepID=UPI000937C25A|nr:hypothetical protein [Scytonema sp. HK-05]OKH52062.1 hypothetical protein NIES2130_32560 [Scytonema sp. HK-05]BAY49831.1 hypothetical protein SAMD00079811_74600 [Scytonema sp. HK-05]